MLALNLMPCMNCENYTGVQQPNGTEIGEYVGCSAANDGNAKSLLVVKGKQFTCPKQIKIDE